MATLPNDEPLWGVAEVCRFLNLSPQAVYSLVKRRRLPHCKPLGPRSLRFIPSELRRLVREAHVDAAPEDPGPHRTTEEKETGKTLAFRL
jgi:excisionase family DNA binding protein